MQKSIGDSYDEIFVSADLMAALVLLDRTLQFECFDRRLILQRLVAPEAIVVGSVGSQPAFGDWPTANFRFREIGRHAW